MGDESPFESKSEEQRIRRFTERVKQGRAHFQGLLPTPCCQICSTWAHCTVCEVHYLEGKEHRYRIRNNKYGRSVPTIIRKSIPAAYLVGTGNRRGIGGDARYTQVGKPFSMSGVNQLGCRGSRAIGHAIRERKLRKKRATTCFSKLKLGGI